MQQGIAFLNPVCVIELWIIFGNLDFYFVYWMKKEISEVIHIW
jgi:hypothetical protein